MQDTSMSRFIRPYGAKAKFGRTWPIWALFFFAACSVEPFSSNAEEDLTALGGLSGCYSIPGTYQAYVLAADSIVFSGRRYTSDLHVQLSIADTVISRMDITESFKVLDDSVQPDRIGSIAETRKIAATGSIEPVKRVVRLYTEAGPYSTGFWAEQNDELVLFFDLPGGTFTWFDEPRELLIADRERIRLSLPTACA
jgi:hypothetical protein